MSTSSALGFVCNGDIGQRVIIDSTQLQWQPSSDGKVWSKLLHRIDPLATGEETLLLRYESNACFSCHSDPGGEEVLVLEGSFQDGNDLWETGSYLLSPEGSNQRYLTDSGCTLFVKRGQYRGHRHCLTIHGGQQPWEQGCFNGIERKALYQEEDFPEWAQLERWGSDSRPGLRIYQGGAEILVLSGTLRDEIGEYRPGTWLRFPAGSSHSPDTVEGCELYIKCGGDRYFGRD